MLFLNQYKVSQSVTIWIWLFRVINGNNVTCSDENMWLIPFNEGQNHELTITFSQALMMAGLRVWNYNKSPEDTYRGVGTSEEPCLYSQGYKDCTEREQGKIHLWCLMIGSIWYWFYFRTFDMASYIYYRKIWLKLILVRSSSSDDLINNYWFCVL